MDFATVGDAEKAMHMFDGATVSGLYYIIRPHERAPSKTIPASQNKKVRTTSTASHTKSHCVGEPIVKSKASGGAYMSPPAKPSKESSSVGKPAISKPIATAPVQMTVLGGERDSDNDDQMSDLSSSFEWEESLLEPPLAACGNSKAVLGEAKFPFMEDAGKLAEMLERCGGGMSLWDRFGREQERVTVKVQAIKMVGHTHCWVHVVDSPEASKCRYMQAGRSTFSFFLSC